MNAAADELHVTQSAVSRQIRLLEEELCIPLFRRVHRGLILTSKGQALASTLREALNLISSGVEHLTQSSERLRINVASTFGIRWLVPRLSRFETRHPEWRIEVSLAWYNFEPKDQGYDVGIIYGRASWPEACLTPVMTERLTPVCSPDFLDRHGPLKQASDFTALQLLHSHYSPPSPGDWHRWASNWDGGLFDTDRGEMFATLDLSLRAAESGRGIAIADLIMIEDDLALQRLALPCPDAIVPGDTYYFVQPEPEDSPPSVLAFRDWLLEEAQASTTQSA